VDSASESLFYVERFKKIAIIDGVEGEKIESGALEKVNWARQKAVIGGVSSMSRETPYISRKQKQGKEILSNKVAKRNPSTGPRRQKRTKTGA